MIRGTSDMWIIPCMVAPIMLQGCIKVNDVHEATGSYISVVIPPLPSCIRKSRR